MNKYKRRRITAVLIIIFLIITIVNKAAPVKAEEEIESYIVVPGDTLWSIAQEHKGDEYILDYMDDLKNLNKSNLENIYPGQEIKFIKK